MIYPCMRVGSLLYNIWFAGVHGIPLYYLIYSIRLLLKTTGDHAVVGRDENNKIE